MKKKILLFLLLIFSYSVYLFGQNKKESTSQKTDIAYLVDILNNKNTKYNDDEMLDLTRVRFEQIITLYDAKYAVEVFEKLIEQTNNIVGNERRIMYYWLLESYQRITVTSKPDLDKIEKKFLDYIKNEKNNCVKAYICRYLAVIYTNNNFKRYSDAKEYFEKSLQISFLNKCDPLFEASQYLEISLSLYEKVGDYKNALDYKMKALKIADSLKATDVIRGFYLDQIARLHYRNENYEKAFDVWQKFLEINQKNIHKNRNIIQSYNNLGLAKRSLGEFGKAEVYFQQAAQEAQMQKDTLWEGITRGNIGISYLKQHKYDQAIPFIMDNIRSSMQFKEFDNAASSLIYLADAYLNLKNYEKARQMYDSTANFIQREKIWVTRSEPQIELKFKMKIYKGLAEIYKELGNLPMAYQYLQLHLEVKDSLLDIRHKSNTALLQAQYEFSEIEHSREKTIKEQKWLLILMLIVVLAFMIISFGLYKLYQLQNIKKNLELENIGLAKKAEKERNQRLQEELALADRNLTIKSLQVHEKNESLIEIKKELQKDDKIHKDLKKLITNTLNFEQDWEDFKKHFEEINPDFFKILQKNHSKITQIDLRHCAYIRLGLGNKEIARLMNISPDSLKVSRSRLKKKLDIPQEITIGQFLSKI